MRRLFLAGTIALAAAAMHADEPEFCLGGTVRNALTGAPLRRAAVTIPQAAALTDAAGAFRFCKLSEGSYYANAEKPGFAETGVRVAVGPSRDDIVLQLQPLAAIGGKVADAAGEPLQNASIQLLSTAIIEGRRQTRVEDTVSTDDRGQYRLAGLGPGRYYLKAAGWGSAMPHADQQESFTPVYYGGAAELSSAAPLTVEPGTEVQADFSLPLLTAYRIRGRATGLLPLLAARIELLGLDREPIAVPAALDNVSGDFRIEAVPPGSYVVRVTQTSQDQPRRGELEIQVNADMQGLVLPLTGSTVVKGIVRRQTDLSAAAQSSTRCTIHLSPASAGTHVEPVLKAFTAPNGDFEIAGVLPGLYRLGIDCAGGYIAAARMGDVDLLARSELLIPAGSPPPIEALLATDGGAVDVARSSEGEPGPAWVLLLPVSGSELYTRFAHLTRQFSFAAVAPGDYQVYAWTGSPEAFAYAAADARQAWASRAVSVHVAARARQTVTLKVTAGETP